MPFDHATVTERRRLFRALHAGPAILIMPNAWDVASARIYEEAGFPAVATSSAVTRRMRGAWPRSSCG